MISRALNLAPNTPYSPRKGAVLRLAATLSLCLAAMSAQAVWLVDPVVEASTGYDDNVRLSNVAVEDAFVADVAGEVRLRRVTEQTELSALIGASYLAYLETDADLKNEDAQYLALDARRTLQTSNFGIRGRYTRDLILRRLAPIPGVLSAAPGTAAPETEIEDIPLIDPFDQLDVETNTTLDQVRRQRWGLEPYLAWNFSELNAFRVAYSYYDRSFDDGERAGLRDTTESELGLGLERQFSPRLTGGINIGIAEYTAKGLGNEEDGEADNYSGVVGINYLLNLRTRLTAEVGASYSENDVIGVDETVAIWDLRLTRDMPASRILVGWNRGTEPSVFGSLIRADRIIASYQQSLSERWEISLDAYAYQTKTVGTAGTDRDNREYFDFAPRITWRVNQSWNLGALYRYRWSERTFDEAGQFVGSAEGNIVSVFVSYQPPRRI